MDSVKIRELEEKSTVNPTDVIVIEDNDGTKVVSVLNLQSAIQKSIFFNTIDDMKAATLNEGDVVKTLGYHNINDGGGATYVIQYAPAETENGITVHYLNTSDTLRAHLVLSGDINPLQAGAYGDGVHDDYSVLNKLIKMRIGITFPSKTFYIGENVYLKLYSDTKINFNNATINGSGGIELGLTIEESVSNISINNLCIDGGSIRLDEFATNINISNCIFYSDTGVSINGAGNVTLSNCIFGSTNRQLKTPIYINSGENIIITGCKIYCTKYGINIDTYPVYDIWVYNVNVNNCSIHGLQTASGSGIRIGSVKKLASISKCTFQHIDTAIALAPNANIQLSVSDISANDVHTVFNMSGGATADTATMIISGTIEFTNTNETSTFRGYLFKSGSIKIINNATYKFNRTANNKIYTGLAHSDNIVYSKDNLYSNLSPLDITNKHSLQLLDIGDFDGVLDYPIFNIEVNVNSSTKILNITTVDIPNSNIGYRGYTGQIITLYSSNNTVLLVNTTGGNIKELGTLNKEIVLQRNKPVKIKYNGAYWVVIEK